MNFPGEALSASNGYPAAVWFRREWLKKSSVPGFISLAFFLILPFIVFFWIAPFFTRNTLGIDYYRHPLQEQLELMFSLRKGSFPLYIPGYWGGVSSSALTLGQIFHPLPHLASLMPGYWQGYSLQWNTFLRLISLGAVNFVLYGTVRRFGAGRVLSFAISFTALYNLTTLFLFRYGASLDNFLGLILLICGIWRAYMGSSGRFAHIWIIFASYILICGGHPKVPYLGLLFAVLACFMTPSFFRAAAPHVPVYRGGEGKFFRNVLLCIGAGMILSSAYVFPFVSDFLMENTDRMGTLDFETRSPEKLAFLVEGTDTFFSPLRGKYSVPYGGAFVFAVIPFLPFARIFGVKIPRIIIMLWAALLLALLVSIEPLFSVYRYFQQYFPIAAGLRGGRWLSVMFPCLTLMLLIWMVEEKAVITGFSGKARKMSLICAICLTVIPFMPVYHIVTGRIMLDKGSWYPVRFNSSPGLVTAFLIAGISGLYFLFLYGLDRKRRFLWGGALCVLLVSQATVALMEGAVFYRQKYRQTMLSMEREKEIKLSFAGMEGNGMASGAVSLHRQKGGIFRSKMAALSPFYVFADTLEEVYTLMGLRENEGPAVVLRPPADKAVPRSPEGLIYEDTDGWSSGPETFPAAERTPEAKDAGPGREWGFNGTTEDISFVGGIDLVHSSFNRVVFEVFADRDVLFTLNYPFTGRWRALVNGMEAKVYRAEGVENGVFIPAGRNTVEFRYWSISAAMGMAVSCAALLLILLYWAGGAGPSRAGPFCRIAAVILCGTLFFLWYNSLYTGRDLGTYYRWRSEHAPPESVLETGWDGHIRLWSDRLSDKHEMNLKNAF